MKYEKLITKLFFPVRAYVTLLKEKIRLCVWTIRFQIKNVRQAGLNRLFTAFLARESLDHHSDDQPFEFSSVSMWYKQ